jgi:hypothetical protein
MTAKNKESLLKNGQFIFEERKKIHQFSLYHLAAPTVTL